MEFFNVILAAVAGFAFGGGLVHETVQALG